MSRNALLVKLERLSPTALVCCAYVFLDPVIQQAGYTGTARPLWPVDCVSDTSRRGLPGIYRHGVARVAPTSSPYRGQQGRVTSVVQREANPVLPLLYSVRVDNRLTDVGLTALVYHARAKSHG